ncbi:GAP family protein [Salinactinospora qingdaonensis]|uniref:Sap, sulfolipid-1-addressing protein n=1 Tax=Salinactinospora qingdaonensis TaxID=702744 RepID=A0ABP7F3X8_9ACTN
MVAQILPLAITMMAGPQIMSAVILVTTQRPFRLSLAFLAGVAVAVAAGVTLAYTIVAVVGDVQPLGEPSERTALGTIAQFALVVALVLLALRNYRNRATAEPPSWLTGLMEATPQRAMAVGLLVILLMPSDILVMLTVATNLVHHGASPLAALPFLVLTLLVAALPLLGLLLFHRRAQQGMSRVRAWMNSYAWLINIVVCLFFVVLILANG